MDFSEIKDIVPQLSGRIRDESWGGIYFERERLTIEILNETAFDFMNLCNSKKSMKEIRDTLLNTYEVNQNLLEKDLLEYFIYMVKSKFIDIDIEKENLFKDEKCNFKNSLTDNGNFKKQNSILGLPPYVLSAPLKVLLELTYNCNLDCVHCFADAEFCKKTEKGYIEGELSKYDWFKIIDNILDSGVFEILLSGGEATMRKDLIDIAEYIKSKGSQYTLLSNTTLIDDKLAKRLKETGCVKVESNLDGYDSNSYDAFRGVSGAFEATLKGIKACQDNDIPVRCNVMETKKTVYDLKEIVNTAYRIGVKEVCVVPLELGGRAISNSIDLEFSHKESEQLTKFYIDVNEWFEKNYGDTDMVLMTPYSLKKISGSRYSKFLDLNDFMPSCGAGKLHCTVDPYGDVKLCPTDHGVLKNEKNNLLTNDLKSIWANSNILRQIRGNEFKLCTSCENDTCKNKCPVTRFNTNKTLNIKCFDFKSKNI